MKQFAKYVMILTGILVATSSCGKQAFKVATISSKQRAPGHFLIPPKIDILLAEDDTGSMFEAFNQITAQFPGLLENLGNRNWDWRLATTPLTTQRTIDQVIGSKFDANWSSLGAEWRPSFPGQSPDFTTAILANFFSTPSQYMQFLTLSEISNINNREEPGFETIYQALEVEAPNANFLRDDAMAIVFTISNGNDSSGVTFCTRPGDGLRRPCEEIGYPQLGTKASSFAEYKDKFRSFVERGLTKDIKFFSATATQDVANCLGGPGFKGERYQQMSQALGGGTVNLCSQGISDVLNEFEKYLEEIKLAYRTRYIVIEPEPNVETIEVIAYRGGVKGGREVIPANDATNGWTYQGYGTVFTIDAVAGQPIEMNRATGYIIELHGKAKLLGDDTAEAKFKTKSGKNSAG